jgi:hypothetical protein
MGLVPRDLAAAAAVVFRHETRRYRASGQPAWRNVTNALVYCGNRHNVVHEPMDLEVLFEAPCPGLSLWS